MSELTKEISSGEHKEILWNKNGLLLRKWDNLPEDYCPEQMKIINKSILFTKDNWESTSTAIGEYHYTDSSGNILETYGINAETLIGMLIIGEQLILRNSNGAMTFDDSGLTIDTKAKGGYAFSIKRDGTPVLSVDGNGNIKFAGTLDGATGTFSGNLNAAGGTFSGDISAASGTFKGSISAESLSVKEKVISWPNYGTHYLIINQESSNSYGRMRFGGEYEGTSGNVYYYGLECYLNTGENEDIESSMVTIDGDTICIGSATKDGFIKVMPSFGGIEAYGTFEAEEVNVSGGLTVSGTKSRIVETSDGTLSLHAYETPTPYFGDIGIGTLNDQGTDTVPIDYLFSNTINTNIEYAVFLQKEGQGDLWVDEKDPLYFVVKGTPGLKYSWELKAVQRDYECVDLDEHSDSLRLNTNDSSDREVSDIFSDIISSIDKEDEELYEYESN